MLVPGFTHPASSLPSSNSQLSFLSLPCSFSLHALIAYQAIKDFVARIAKYEAVYEPLDDRSFHYIKLIGGEGGGRGREGGEEREDV